MSSPDVKTMARAPGRLGPGVTGLTLRADRAGLLEVRIAYDARPDGAPAVEISVDGVRWATIGAQLGAEPGGDGKLALLSCHVPHRRAPSELDITLRWAPGGALIGRQRVRMANPVSNPHGLPAHEVFGIDVAPMHSVPWLSFDGAELVISGAHLPPGGDPSRLGVELGEGVAGVLEYPLPSPEFGAHYWYWPNAHLSGFRLRINLAASAPGSDPFGFRFETGDAPEPAATNARPWPDRSRVWLPRDLGDFVGQPGDGTQLTRVQTWSEQKTVTFTGYNAFRGLESLLAWHGVTPRAGLRLLDWGCGHGRVARHFIRNWPQARIIGADIDAENIAWCQANLAGGDFVTAPLWPPMAVPDQSFDAIFGLSVMTHLSADAQRAWLDEIHRLLKPGGVALISFGGDGAAAYASLHHTPQWWADWRARGFDDGLRDPALAGKIADETYYRVTHQSPAQVMRSWQGLLAVVAIEHQAFGYQDIAVLRRPEA
jgi:SAM-dependent methyltransferase